MKKKENIQIIEEGGISTRHNSSVSIKDTTAGITLIALVITIIVLLIIAGVAISMLSGENGILKQAADAKTKTGQESILEQIKLDLNAKTIEEKRKLTDEEVMDIIKSYDKDNKIRDYTYIETKDDQIIDITDIHVVMIGEEIAEGLTKDTDNNNQYYVYTAEGLSNLNKMMQNKTLGYNVCVKIQKDINFSEYTWNSITSHTELGFSLKELDGNGHTIENITINGNAMFSMLAGSGKVIIKNIIFNKAKVNSSANVAIIADHIYQNTLLENVMIKNSEIVGTYTVAPLIANVYNENNNSTITLTLKNCKVENCIVKSTKYDYYTAGMVAYVDKDDKEEIVFEGNNVVKDVKLYAPNVYDYHANIYAIFGNNTTNLINESENVTVENVTFQNI